MIDKSDIETAGPASDATNNDTIILDVRLEDSTPEQGSKSVETALVQTLQRFLRDQG